MGLLLTNEKLGFCCSIPRQSTSRSPRLISESHIELSDVAARQQLRISIHSDTSAACLRVTDRSSRIIIASATATGKGATQAAAMNTHRPNISGGSIGVNGMSRSEERRVGKEGKERGEECE